jgi:undecaprenyl-diphosphatase
MNTSSEIKQSQKKSPLLASLVRLLREAGWYILAGLAGSILLLYLFADLTEDVFTNEFTKFDDNFELWVHSFSSSGLTIFFEFFTTIGSIAGISILTVITFGLLWWRHHLRSAWLLALAVGGGILINQVLKQLFHRPRPELWDITGSRLTTFSFPSGHATVSLCYFGVLAWLGFRLLKPRWARWLGAALMVFCIVMVGLSRIYFGVHYPTDVIGGYLSGTFWLVILLDGATIFNRIRKKAQPAANDKDR